MKSRSCSCKFDKSSSNSNAKANHLLTRVPSSVKIVIKLEVIVLCKLINALPWPESSYWSRTPVAGLEHRLFGWSRILSDLEYDDHLFQAADHIMYHQSLGSIEFSRLCIYMGPVARQVDYHQVTQGIQSSLCCAYITAFIVIFIKSFSRSEALNCT
jgi:hypothetical protein